MTIYESTQAHPYVYIGTHQITKQFYIGYRQANKLPSTSDLANEYYTSSKHIKKLGFENFEWMILAEFFSEDSGQSAYRYEQQLIMETINDPLSLNYHFTRNDQKVWIRSGPCSESHKRKFSDTRIDKFKANPELKLLCGFHRKNKKFTEQQRSNISQGLINALAKPETKVKRSIANKNENNPRSRNVKFKDQEFKCLKFAILATGLSRHMILKHPDFSFLT